MRSEERISDKTELSEIKKCWNREEPATYASKLAAISSHIAASFATHVLT